MRRGASPSLRSRRRRVTAARFAAALLFCTTASAAPLAITEAEQRALQDEPGAAELLSQAQAFEELAVAAGELPDPQLRLGAANLPLEGGGFRTEGMTQAQLGLRQTFPPATARAAAARHQKRLAAERRALAGQRTRNVLLMVREAWLETWLHTRSRHLVTSARGLFESLVATTRSLYSVGGRDQQDVLRAELELSHLAARLIAIEQRQEQARAGLRRWVGAAAERDLAPALPSWSAPSGMAALEDALAEHPALAAATARVDAGHAAVALAHSRYRPGWTVDVGYGYRDGSLPNGLPRSDFLSVSALVSLPLFTENRQDRGLAAARARLHAALAAQDELRRELLGELRHAHAGWGDLSRSVQLYEEVITSQAQANAAAALAAYRSETGDFADVMRSHINHLEVRLELLRLRVERHRQRAQLAFLSGAAP